MTDSKALAKLEADEQFSTAQHWLSLLGPFEITNDEEQDQVAGVLRDVKARHKFIEEKRKEITGPMNDALRAVNNLFRPPRERFEELERLLKAKIARYLEAKAQANVAALQLAAAAPTPAVAQQAIAQVAPVEPPRGVSVRYVWAFEVTDPTEVPREFCSPDPEKIKRYIAETPGAPVMRGVRFTKQASVTARRG